AARRPADEPAPGRGNRPPVGPALLRKGCRRPDTADSVACLTACTARSPGLTRFRSVRFIWPSIPTDRVRTRMCTEGYCEHHAHPLPDDPSAGPAAAVDRRRLLLAAAGGAAALTLTPMSFAQAATGDADQA